jgi:hypothetical protein
LKNLPTFQILWSLCFVKLVFYEKAVGAQAGQKQLTQVLNAAGFSQVRRAAVTPTNLVLEAKV